MIRFFSYFSVIIVAAVIGWFANQYSSQNDNSKKLVSWFDSLQQQAMAMVKTSEATPPVIENETALEHAEKHLDPNYVCPMHPQIVKGEPGSCPICGMDLVQVEAEEDAKPQMSMASMQNLPQETAMEHAQKHMDPSYVCPMHPQIVKDEAGSCPICGMDLVAVEAEQEETPQMTMASMQSPAKETAMEHAQKHLDPTYVCPMHPQIVKDEAGSCPICGMDLVAVEAEQEETPQMTMASMQSPAKETAMEHAQKHLDPTYVCPMHPQIVKDEAGSCPICGMDLVEVEAEQPQNSAKKDKKILYWVAPMDPNYRRDEPGKSPMGMDLVPVYAEQVSKTSKSKTVVVKIDPGVVNNLGVQIDKVKSGSLYRELDTVAYVDYDEDKLSHVHQFSDGWIEKLYVKSIGDEVKKGDLLYAVYSPDLINAQEDYLLSLKNKFKGVEKASRERLYSLGFTNSQIKRLKKRRKIERTLKTYAKHSGIVVQLNVREGMYIKPQTEVMTLADLNYIWFIAEVYEKQSAWVEKGQDVKITMDAYPGKEWYGDVDYIYPEMDRQSRTLKVRVRMPNQHGLFKLNMYAKVKIYTQKIEKALYIPLQALIQSGDESRVIIQQEQGRFSPRVVVAGMESDNKIEIKSGLEEGENVVVSGQFLIDSEASLKASLLRFKNKG